MNTIHDFSQNILFKFFVNKYNINRDEKNNINKLPIQFRIYYGLQ